MKTKLSNKITKKERTQKKTGKLLSFKGKCCSSSRMHQAER